MAATSDAIEIELDGRDVRITNPAKVFFPQAPAGPLTKLDLVQYYLTVAPGVRWSGAGTGPTCTGTPTASRREIYQKRVPAHRPPWIQTATVRFPSGRSAEFLAIRDAAHLAWAINLGCLDLNPWPVRRADVDHPDELRVDLDPTPGAPFDDARHVALVVRDVLEEHGLTGFPKTSGSRGIHVNVRIEPRWDFTEVRRAALALAREVERRVPDIATTAWWKEERHGVFIDYNQNAQDRTVASAYSGAAGARRQGLVPTRLGRGGGHRPIDAAPRHRPPTLRRDRRPRRGHRRPLRQPGLAAPGPPGRGGGLGDAPWPPHFPKAKGEPRRVAPSRARKDPAAGGD